METYNYMPVFDNAVESNNKRAEKNGAVANLTTGDLAAAFIYFDGKCAYSGRDLRDQKHVSIEHIIPLVSGGHSLAFNCVPVVEKYNSSKSGYHLLDWWRAQSDGMGNTIYNPYRLLKLMNYMVKCLESIDMEDKHTYILTPNEIDIFLSEHREDLNSNIIRYSSKDAGYKKISQLEILQGMDILKDEDMYLIYEGLDGIKLNPAILFEEGLHELQGAIPQDVLDILNQRICKMPNIYIDGKKVFKKEMHEEDIKLREEILAWAEEEKIENKYGVIGYMNFELLKEQKDVRAFLNERKKIILRKLGAREEDFNNVINKVPNILTNLSVEKRIADISKGFNISTQMRDKKSSEMYRYVVNKPDLLLAGENMEILLKYTGSIDIDKRLLKKGIPISTIIDNIEISIQLVDMAGLEVDSSIKARIIDKMINNSNGNLIRNAYKKVKGIVKSENEGFTSKQIESDAAKWIICMSEKYNTSEIFKDKRVDKTRTLYRNIRFNQEGYMIGVNPNAYIVPHIVRMANLNIPREAEEEIINNVFFVREIHYGKRADKIYNALVEEVKKDNPDCDEEHVLQDAARWFVFLSENSQLRLADMFNDKLCKRYIAMTKDHYKHMEFDEKGNFRTKNIEELNKFEEEVRIDAGFMKIVDSFFRRKGNAYLIGEKLVPRREIQEMLYEELKKCKNKREVKATCIKLLKSLSKQDEDGKKKRGKQGQDRG